MQQQQQEVKENQQKKTQNAQAAMMSELKSNIAVKRPKDSRKIGKDEIYHGALEDILTGLFLFNACYLDLVSTEMNLLAFLYADLGVPYKCFLISSWSVHPCLVRC